MFGLTKAGQQRLAMGVVCGLQEQAIRWIVAFIPVAITQRGKKIAKTFHLGFGHLQTHQHASYIASLITIMEEADIPVRRQTVQKAY